MYWICVFVSDSIGVRAYEERCDCVWDAWKSVTVPVKISVEMSVYM